MSPAPEHSDAARDHRDDPNYDPDFADIDERAELRAAGRKGALVIDVADLKDAVKDLDLQRLSVMDDRLLEMAGKRMSFVQMYEELGEPDGMSPASIGTRVRTLLAAFELDAVEQKALLLRDLVRLRDIIFDQLEGENFKLDKDDNLIPTGPEPAWANAMVRLLKEWRSTVESMQKDLDGDRASLREAHAQIMMQAITVMFERFVLRLEEAGQDEFSGITFSGSRAALMGLFGEVMPLGFEHLQRNVDPREQRVRNG